MGDDHSFTTELTEGCEIIVAVKGDVTGDGVVNNGDVLRMKQLANGVGAAATELQQITGNIIGSTASLDNGDVLKMKQVANRVGNALAW